MKEGSLSQSHKAYPSRGSLCSGGSHAGQVSGPREAKEKRGGPDAAARTKSRKARCVPFFPPPALGSVSMAQLAMARL